MQRVEHASVRVDGDVVGEIDRGLFVLVAVGHASTDDDARWLAAKTEALRIFPALEDGVEARGRMDRDVREVGGGVLAISQFTLYGDTRKGRRPSFIDAAPPASGDRLYGVYCDALTVPVARGVFGAHMVIEAVCDGPVTLLLEREGSTPVP